MRTPQGNIDKGNAFVFKRRFERRVATYRTVLERRGIPQRLAGGYKIGNVSPECAKSGSPLAVAIYGKTFERVEIVQKDLDLTLAFDKLGGKDPSNRDSKADIAAVAVESMVVLTDPLDSNYLLVGQINDRLMVMRPKSMAGLLQPGGAVTAEACAFYVSPEH